MSNLEELRKQIRARASSDFCAFTNSRCNQEVIDKFISLSITYENKPVYLFKENQANFMNETGANSLTAIQYLEKHFDLKDALKSYFDDKLNHKLIIKTQIAVQNDSIEQIKQTLQRRNIPFSEITTKLNEFQVLVEIRVPEYSYDAVINEIKQNLK
ncbi:Hypothetical_protein [Hexamita inflata]|uniref:Hypothetical_protein n=1 Tax=Hexamita inflata TaxID=28002 RepID=A0AA86N4X0_9EUKA|nr:Hypothetical protein HINF_LOCUS491 [Hexamita inflata]